jgi:hypothetical protein
MNGPRNDDFPPGLQGGLEHDDEDHRLGEGGAGPEAPEDAERNRAHPGKPADDDAGQAPAKP